MVGIIAIAFALCNMLGGRFQDVCGEKPPIDDRLFFRAIMPTVILALAAQDKYGLLVALYTLVAVFAGSCVWFSSGWSFEEQNGVPDPIKYPAILRRLGYWLWPEDGSVSTNKKRGIFMKGVRGSYDLLTFALLLPLNKYALYFWPLTFSMGAVYWFMARIVPGVRHDVLSAEAAYGYTRGFILGSVLLSSDLTYWGRYFA